MSSEHMMRTVGGWCWLKLQSSLLLLPTAGSTTNPTVIIFHNLTFPHCQTQFWKII